MSTTCINTDDSIQHVLVKMGLGADVWGVDEAHRRFQLIQVDINEAIKRLLRDLRLRRGGLTCNTAMGPEDAEGWFQLLLAHVYDVARGSDTVWYYENGNHHNGVDNCVVRWLLQFWWRAQGMDALGSVLTARSTALGSVFTSQSRSLGIVHDSFTFKEEPVETAEQWKPHRDAAPWPHIAIPQFYE